MTGSLTQPFVFLLFFYCGILCGAFYGVLSLLRDALSSRVLNSVLDLLFVCGTAMLIGGGFLIATGGRLRGYAFIAVFLGAYLERHTLGVVFQNFLKTLRKTR